MKDTDQHESEKKISRSVLEMNYRLLEILLTEVTSHNMELLNTVHELLEKQNNLGNLGNVREFKQQVN